MKSRWWSGDYFDCNYTDPNYMYAMRFTVLYMVFFSCPNPCSSSDFYVFFFFFFFFFFFIIFGWLKKWPAAPKNPNAKMSNEFVMFLVIKKMIPFFIFIIFFFEEFILYTNTVCMYMY